MVNAISRDGNIPSVARSSATLVLLLMFLFNMLNFLDRMLFAVLQEEIKRDLQLSDAQLGILGGPAFAILYALASLPIARLADRYPRKYIISTVLSFWSVMTGLTGLATNFVQILLCRVGISIGEAGCAPAAHSLISSYFTPERRTGAIAIFTSGTSIGTLTAAFGGGFITSLYGWRVTFILCGALGIVLAAVILFTIREAPIQKADVADQKLGKVMRMLLAKRSFIHLCAGMSLATMGGFAAVQYLTSFLIRAHELDLQQGAGITGVIVGGVGFLASIASGMIVDLTRQRWPRMQMTLPAVGVTIGGIAFLVAFTVGSLALCLVMLVIAVFGMQSFLGPGFTLAQDLVKPSYRSTTAGILMLIIGLAGYTFGSPLVGIVSDNVAAGILDGTLRTFQECLALTDDATCAYAQDRGLRAGLAVVVLTMPWAGIHFWLARTTILADKEEA